jgi:hypothetical protein
MAGHCCDEARRKHGKPCYDERGGTRLPGALAATPAYENRLLVSPADPGAPGYLMFRATRKPFWPLRTLASYLKRVDETM